MASFPPPQMVLASVQPAPSPALDGFRVEKSLEDGEITVATIAVYIKVLDSVTKLYFNYTST